MCGKITLALIGIAAVSSLAVTREFAISLPASVSVEVLEPSVLNEVEHALSVAPVSAVTNGIPLSLPEGWPATNFHSLAASDRAIRLVSLQRSNGRWYDGTNDVTGAVVTELEMLSGTGGPR